MEFLLDSNDGHRDRLRLRLENISLEEMKQQDILEFLLCYVIPRQDVHGIARNLMDHFYDLQGVFTADPAELEEVIGMGGQVMEWMVLLQDYMRRGRWNLEEDRRLIDYRKLGKYVRGLGKEYARPCCMVLGLDKFFFPMAYQRICAGREWADLQVMPDPVSTVLSLHPRNLFILIYTDRLAADFTDYDIQQAYELALTLKGTSVDVLDVFLINTHHTDSMRSMGLFQDPELTDFQKDKRDYYCLRREPPEDDEIFGNNRSAIAGGLKFTTMYEDLDCEFPDSDSTFTCPSELSWQEMEALFGNEPD